MHNLFKFVFLLTFILFGGCHVKKEISAPNQQFVFISKEFEITLCDIISDKCVNKTAGIRGSGVLIGHNESKKKSYILSVAHVCDDYLEPPTPFHNIKLRSSKFILKNALIEKEYSGTIHAIDHVNDLCLIETDYINYRPMKIAKEAPTRHKKYFNIGAPYGIWAKNNSLLFEGYYTGIEILKNYVLDTPEQNTICTDEQINKDLCIVKDTEMQMFTIPTAQGASGSPIYNEKGELVGIIARVMIPIHHICLGASHKTISNFVKKHIK